MSPRPLLLDSSVAVALLLEAHHAHRETVAALRGSRLGLSGHALFETMSVLTRLPGEGRRAPSVVHTALARSFPETRFLSSEGSLALAGELAGLGIGGGAVYDGLVAATARESRLTLVTRDARALPTYRALGVDLRLLE